MKFVVHSNGNSNAIAKKTLDKVKKDICCSETFIAKTTIHAFWNKTNNERLSNIFKLCMYIWNLEIMIYFQYHLLATSNRVLSRYSKLFQIPEVKTLQQNWHQTSTSNLDNYYLLCNCTSDLILVASRLQNWFIVWVTLQLGPIYVLAFKFGILKWKKIPYFLM